MLLTRLFAATALALTALAPAAMAEERRAIEGTATYMARIALPPDAEVAVEARGFNEESLGFSRVPTGGAQVPLPFELDIPPRLRADLRVAIFVDGAPRWLSAPVAVEPGVDPVDVGEVMLRAYTPMGFASEMVCGDRRLRLGFAGNKALLDTGRGVLELEQVRAASGARFETPDGSAMVWTKGDGAMVEIDGEALPECRLVPPDAAPAWTARGNEPFWTLELQGGKLTLTTGMGAETRTAQLPDPVIADGAFTYEMPEADIRLTVAETICRDSMSGMPHPQTVAVETGGETLRGCGGAPLELLTGREWVVEDIAGDGLIDSTRVTVHVGREGRVSGTGGCNRYTGQFELTGERLTIGPVAGTMMACPEAIMNQEQRFFEALGRVDGFDIDETGALHLRGDGETVILARR